jgi:hypothetical protein
MVIVRLEENNSKKKVKKKKRKEKKRKENQKIKLKSSILTRKKIPEIYADRVCRVTARYGRTRRSTRD